MTKVSVMMFALVYKNSAHGYRSAVQPQAKRKYYFRNLTVIIVYYYTIELQHTCYITNYTTSCKVVRYDRMMLKFFDATPNTYTKTTHMVNIGSVVTGQARTLFWELNCHSFMLRHYLSKFLLIFWKKFNFFKNSK